MPFIAPSEPMLMLINTRIEKLINSLKEFGTYDIEDENILNQLIREVYGF